MSTRRQLHLTAYLGDIDNDTLCAGAATRYAVAGDIERYRKIAKIAERGKLDALVLAEHPLKRERAQGVWSALDPFALIAAVASVTEHIGLVTSAAIDADDAHRLARRFANLYRAGDERIGWHVLSPETDAAPVFAQQNHNVDETSRRFQIAAGVWAFLGLEDNRTTKTSIPGRRGPVIIQQHVAGNSQDLELEFLDGIFTNQSDKESAQSFYGEMKKKAALSGRERGDLLVLPFARFLIADNEGEAKTLQHQWDSTVGERRSGYFVKAGTPDQIASLMEDWFKHGAADGFNLVFDTATNSLSRFVDLVVPLLQRKQIFKSEYIKQTLRSRLNLMPQIEPVSLIDQKARAVG